MQCGVPTVTSNATSLPEVVGDGGITLPPTDEDALSQVMSDFYENESLRQKYSVAALERAGTFSWQRTANEYATIFKNIG
jgi:glycosyltransferase involved in cell wall biosynthesis